MFISSSFWIVDEHSIGSIGVLTQDTNAVKYSLDGDDASLFTIDSHTGVLSFIDAPRFEIPLDVDSNGQYTLDVIATDLFGNSSTQRVNIAVNNMNDAPIVEDMSAAQDEAIDGLNIVSDLLLETDVDEDDTHTFELVDGSIKTISDVEISVSDIEITKNANGEWIYNAEGNFNSLTIGESAIVTFDYIAIDNLGLASEPKTISVTVNGTVDQDVVDLLDVTQVNVDT